MFSRIDVIPSNPFPPHAKYVQKCTRKKFCARMNAAPSARLLWEKENCHMLRSFRNVRVTITASNPHTAATIS